MANASEKKIHAQNSSILLRLRILFLLATTVYWGFASVGQRLTRHLLPYALSTALSLGSWRLVSAMATASFDARGRLKGVGADLQASGGVAEYLVDFVQVTWLVHLLVAVSDWALWWAVYLVVVVGFAVWKVRSVWK